jgi:hypothetical protein
MYYTFWHANLKTHVDGILGLEGIAPEYLTWKVEKFG